MKAGRNEKLLVPLPPTVVRYINVIGFVKSNPVGTVVTLAPLGMFAQQFFQHTFCSSSFLCIFVCLTVIP